MFTDEEEDWFRETIHVTVSGITLGQLEDLGITDDQLVQLGIPKPRPSPAPAARRKLKTTPF